MYLYYNKIILSSAAEFPYLTKYLKKCIIMYIFCCIGENCNETCFSYVS